MISERKKNMLLFLESSGNDDLKLRNPFDLNYK